MISSRDATRAGFKAGLILAGEDWMQMITDCNQTSHTYDPWVAQAMVANILERFYPAFAALLETLANRS